MFEDAILDIHVITAKFKSCIFPNFYQNIAEIPNSMGMGHFPKILEKKT
jgi:hypothetical protein